MTADPRTDADAPAYGSPAPGAGARGTGAGGVPGPGPAASPTEAGTLSPGTQRTVLFGLVAYVFRGAVEPRAVAPA